MLIRHKQISEVLYEYFVQFGPISCLYNGNPVPLISLLNYSLLASDLQAFLVDVFWWEVSKSPVIRYDPCIPQNYLTLFLKHHSKTRATLIHPCRKFRDSVIVVSTKLFRYWQNINDVHHCKSPYSQTNFLMVWQAIWLNNMSCINRICSNWVTSSPLYGWQC